MSSSEIDGPLYVEVNKVWEEVYVTITGTRLEAFKRIREDVPASKSNIGVLVTSGLMFGTVLSITSLQKYYPCSV